MSPEEGIQARARAAELYAAGTRLQLFVGGKCVYTIYVDKVNCEIHAEPFAAAVNAAFVALASDEAKAEREAALTFSDEELEIARKAIEDVLIEYRDARISTLRRNGLVVKEKDGRDSHIIRLGPEDAVRLGVEAIRRSRSSSPLKESLAREGEGSCYDDAEVRDPGYYDRFLPKPGEQGQEDCVQTETRPWGLSGYVRILPKEVPAPEARVSPEPGCACGGREVKHSRSVCYTADPPARDSE